jgi:hypothetical protein
MVPEVQAPEFSTPLSIPLGGGAAIMGGELSVTNAVWCRMFARADITPTAIGPESQRRIVLANPAPLDIDEPRAPIRRTPPTRNGRAALARKSPAGAGSGFGYGGAHRGWTASTSNVEAAIYVDEAAGVGGPADFEDV